MPEKKPFSYFSTFFFCFFLYFCCCCCYSAWSISNFPNGIHELEGLGRDGERKCVDFLIFICCWWSYILCAFSRAMNYMNEENRYFCFEKLLEFYGELLECITKIREMSRPDCQPVLMFEFKCPHSRNIQHSHHDRLEIEIKFSVNKNLLIQNIISIIFAGESVSNILMAKIRKKQKRRICKRKKANKRHFCHVAMMTMMEYVIKL